MGSSINNSITDHVRYTIIPKTDLPFHCPPKDASKWNSHPKVFLKFDKNGSAMCPYCGSNYTIEK